MTDDFRKGMITGMSLRNSIILDRGSGANMTTVYGPDGFNPEICKSTDITHKITKQNNEDYSAYLLSDYFIELKQNISSTAGYSDANGTLLRGNQGATYVGASLFIPINRIYGVKKVCAKARRTTTGGGVYHSVTVKSGYVVDGELVIAGGDTDISSQSYIWTDLQHNVESPFIDYIVMLSSGTGYTEYMDIRIE